MALKHARTVRYANGNVASYHYDDESETPRSTLGDGEAAQQVHAKIAAVKFGLEKPEIPDLETLTALLASKHAEWDRSSQSHAALEAKHEAMGVLHQQLATTIADGTGASIDDVHKAAGALAVTLASNAFAERLQLHCETTKDAAFAAVAAEVQAHKTKMVEELHAAIDVELRDHREVHAASSAMIGAAIADLPDVIQRAVLAKHPEMQPHLDAHVAAFMGDAPLEAKATPQ